jgi:hypothetical protein
MAYEEELKCVTRPANTDLSALQYTFVALNSSGNVIAPTGQGAAVIGVLQNKPSAAGMPAQVAYSGVSKVKLGADSLDSGIEVTTGADGQAETAASGDISHGTLFEGGDTDEIVACLLHINGNVIA